MAITEVKRFQELDALRGIAAILVVFFHFTAGRVEYNSILKLGTTGVDLFFIISGFVIFMSLQKIKCSRDFIINRTSRLYPTYWTAVTLAFFLLSVKPIINGTFQIKESTISYLGNMTMFQFYFRIPDLDPPYWTMIIEMLFYIGILFLYQFKILKYLNFFGTVISLSSVILCHFWYKNIVAETIIKGIPLMQFLPLFFAGTLFYKLYTSRNQYKLNITLLVLCYLCQLSLFPYAGRAHLYISTYEYALMLTIYFILFTGFVTNNLKFIVNKITLFLGKISFALYLTHECVTLEFVIPKIITPLQLNFWVSSIFINLPIVLIIASFITYKIEVPWCKKMKASLHDYFNKKNIQSVNT
jgi:peptidoglycan/LPS O-acetylase OafA/YrhL